MTELRVEMLRVVERLPASKYRCLCDCGNERIVNVGHFNSGTVKSCGCTRFQKYPEGAHGPCTIDGCANERCNSHGYCWRHYTRLRRHGDVSATQFGKPQAWLLAHVEHEVEGCLTWPFGGRDNGYGTLVFDVEHDSAHRKMCELKHGPAPSPTHHAAHSCGRGHLGCVHPDHLSWKTPVENNADKLLHGTHSRGERNSGARLKARDIFEIRRLYAVNRKESYRAIGQRYGVSDGAIKGVLTGATWGWLK